MKKVELHIIALADSTAQEGRFTLILEERKGERRLPITIGRFEAQAIAVALEQISMDRPLTHDLFKTTLELSGISLKEVVISDFKEGVFHATLVGTKADDSPLEVDARSSDAIALAVRFACPIYTTAAILDKVGLISDRPSRLLPHRKRDLSEYSLEELKALLEEVLAKEDYEMASKIRDAIEGRE